MYMPDFPPCQDDKATPGFSRPPGPGQAQQRPPPPMRKLHAAGESNNFWRLTGRGSVEMYHDSHFGLSSTTPSSILTHSVGGNAGDGEGPKEAIGVHHGLRGLTAS